jgi:hypothetical protein
MVASFVQLLSTPGRATEVVASRARNGFSVLRSMYIVDGRVVFHVGYHKMLSLTGSGLSTVVRFMPRPVTGLLLGALIVLPKVILFAIDALETWERGGGVSQDGVGRGGRVRVEGRWAREKKLFDSGSLYPYPDCPKGAEQFRKEFKRYVLLFSEGRIDMGIAMWRQFATVINRLNQDPTRPLHNIHAVASSLSFNHSEGRAVMSYGVDSTRSFGYGGATEEECRAYQLASMVHYNTVGYTDLGFITDDPYLGLCDTVRSLFITPALYDDQYGTRGGRRRLRRRRRSALFPGDRARDADDADDADDDDDDDDDDVVVVVGGESERAESKRQRVLIESVKDTVNQVVSNVGQVLVRVEQVLSVTSSICRGYPARDEPAIMGQTGLLPIAHMCDDWFNVYKRLCGKALYGNDPVMGVGAGFGVIKVFAGFHSPEQANVTCLAMSCIEVDTPGRIQSVIYVSGTGSGKSLSFLGTTRFCSEYNSTHAAGNVRKCVVVIVPYRALLKELWIRCQLACLNDYEAQVWTGVGGGIQRLRASVVLISCEALTAGGASARLWMGRHATVVFFDEVHVLLTESDFRRSMMGCAEVLARVEVPCFLLSATVGFGDADKLCQLLGRSIADPTRMGINIIRSPRTVRRDVYMRSEMHPTKALVMDRVVQKMQEHMYEGLTPVLFFCSTVRDVEAVYARVCREFPGLKHRVGVYHGRLDDATKDSVYLALRTARLFVLIATSAFGVGLDFECLRTVYLVGPPLSLVGLAQLSGRVGRGRGGGGSVFLLLWNSAARDLQRMFGMGGGEYEELDMMCRPGVCLPSLLTEKFDAAPGMMCVFSDEFKNCFACATGLTSESVPSAGMVVENVRGTRVFNDVGLFRTRRSMDALDCAQRFGELVEWSLSISWCFECFAGHVAFGNAVGACMLSPPPYLHKGGCYDCIIQRCRQGSCCCAALKVASNIETCWVCRMPCMVAGGRTDSPLEGSQAHARAARYATVPGNACCSSGLQDWFCGCVYQGAALWARNNNMTEEVGVLRHLITDALHLPNWVERGLFGLAVGYLRYAQHVVNNRQPGA